MRIVITGGCGFVGSSLAVLLKKKYPRYSVSCFDNLRRRGSELNIPRFKDAGIEFIHGDIRIPSDFDVIEEADIIIDAAAEPSVQAGQNEGLDYLIETNYNGTFNTLKLAVKHSAKLIFLSTSRVYSIPCIDKIRINETQHRFEIDETQEINGVTKKGISEIFPVIQGYRSLYGSTKLASELLIQEFEQTFGLQAVTNRCGVISGPFQMGKIDQGVAVLWMAKHYWNKPLQYIGYGGEGKQVRDILHIDDLSALISWQIENFQSVSGETFNVGGGAPNSISLKEMTTLCEEIVGRKIEIGSQSSSRPGDIPIYVSDYSKLIKSTDWRPQKNTKDIFVDIFEWINQNEKSLKSILS